MTEERRQARQHRVGRLGLFEQHQRRNAVQRVEQEMRIELIAQHRELRAGCLRFQLHQLVILFFHAQEEIDRIVKR